MSDEIDPSKWGVPEEPSAPVKEPEPSAVQPAMETKKKTTRQPRDRENSISRSTDTCAPARSKILTASILAGLIRDSKIGITGEQSCKNWFLQTKGKKHAIRARAGELEYLIELFRKARTEGYQ